MINHLVQGEHALQVHPERELGHVRLNEGGDGGVAELEDLGHLLLPLLVLLTDVVVHLDKPVGKMSKVRLYSSVYAMSTPVNIAKLSDEAFETKDKSQQCNGCQTSIDSICSRCKENARKKIIVFKFLAENQV